MDGTSTGKGSANSRFLALIPNDQWPDNKAGMLKVVVVSGDLKRVGILRRDEDL